MASGAIDLAVASPAPTRRHILTAVLLTATLVLAATAVVTAVALGWSFEDAMNAFVASNTVMALSFGGCGAILAWQRPGNPIGWLFAVSGFLQSLSASGPPVGTLAQQSGVAESLQRVLATIFVGAWPWAIGLCIPVALLLFPDGRPVARQWRPVVAAVVITAPLFVLEMAAGPASDEGPLPYLALSEYERLGALWFFAELRTGIAYLLGVLALILRYRRGTDVIRRQLLWLLLAMVVVVLALVPWGFIAGTPVAVLFAIPLIPISITVAIVRHRLLDIRLVVSRAVAWLVLSLAVIVIYVGLVAVLDRVVASSIGSSAVATVILVLLAAPLLPRLQRLVDRALYGDRSDPARVVSRLGTQLATPDAGLPGLAESIRSALRLPYVQLVGADDPLAAAGTPGSVTDALPLTYGGTVTGRVVVGLRLGERRLSEADRRVLELLAAPLAVAVHATVVSDELQTARVRLVEAREEERRVLRRELHDGIGPTLTGIAFTADAAANVVGEPGRVQPLLDALRRDTRAALADVRRVVEDLRPPALDEFGLLGAVQRRADQLRWRDGGVPLVIEIASPDPLPTLPAAVEAATYRIVTEALTNAARHSEAARVTITLTVADELGVEIVDDGRESADWVPGVGLQAMRERVAELGGEVWAGPTPIGGVVRAELPLELR